MRKHANGESLAAVGMGSAIFLGPVEPVTFRDVLDVPGLDKNLVSMPRLTQKNLTVQISASSRASSELC